MYLIQFPNKKKVLGYVTSSRHGGGVYSLVTLNFYLVFTKLEARSAQPTIETSKLM